MTDTLTSNELAQQQVAAQYRVIAALSKAIAQVHKEAGPVIASSHNEDFLNMVGAQSAALMETLGDILNNMDAVSDDDEWMEPIFEEAQRRWPRQPPAPETSDVRSRTGSNERAAFERYILIERGPNYLKRNDPTVDAEHDYADDFIQEAWEAWLARSSNETSERSPNDYAIEHGGYLAKSAEDFLTVLNDVAMAECGLATWDEEDPEYAGAKALVDQAWERRHDHWTGLQSAIYEFRKRAERANAQKASEQRGESRAEFERDRGFVRRCPKCNRDVSSGCNYCACPYPQSPAVSEPE